MSIIDEIKAKFPFLADNQIQAAIQYLKDYGYLNGNLSDEKVYQATKEFQEFFDLDQDGLLGPKTIRAMDTHRCGVKDILPLRTEEAKWRKRDLKYFIESYDPDLPKSVVDEIIFKAWQSWCEIADLTIQPTTSSSKADIVIGTGRGKSSDFDGPSGTLAWATIPDGRDSKMEMRFDLDDTWVDSPNKRGILLLNVAAHEGGHNLGLLHSKVSTALMAPIYSPLVSKPQKNDDESRIIEMYGKAKDTPVTPTPPSQPPVGDEETVTMTIKGKDLKINIPGWRVLKI